jgi:uncharacterized membrane protein
VLESELLDALERALQLEWVRADMPLAPLYPVPRPPEAQAGALPPELREELRRLARQGNASALRQCLRQARAEWPQHAAVLEPMQACADRFDFAALTEQLMEDEDAAPA